MLDDKDTDMGVSLGMLFGGVVVLFLVMVIVFEFKNVLTVKSVVSRELGRAANIGIITAMDDNYRKDGFSKIDGGVARDAFYDYAVEALELDGSLRHKSGPLEYRMDMDALVMDRPPEIVVEAVIYLKPIFLQGAIEKYIGDALLFEIPINVKSRNQRLDV